MDRPRIGAGFGRFPVPAAPVSRSPVRTAASPRPHRQRCPRTRPARRTRAEEFVSMVSSRCGARRSYYRTAHDRTDARGLATRSARRCCFGAECARSAAHSSVRAERSSPGGAAVTIGAVVVGGPEPVGNRSFDEGRERFEVSAAGVEGREVAKLLAARRDEDSRPRIAISSSVSRQSAQNPGQTTSTLRRPSRPHSVSVSSV